MNKQYIQNNFWESNSDNSGKVNLKEIHNKIILVQSVEQSKIILNNKNKNNIFCFVPSSELQESLMNNRNDSEFVKDVDLDNKKIYLELIEGLL